MDVAGRVAVVTGGGGGIGSALARRLVDAGARVVVADLDGAQAAAVADPLGEAATAVECDVAELVALESLLRQAETAFGPVDVFFANAGILHPGGPDTPEDDWDIAFDVNVRAHVRAAQLLLPGWLQRGEGYFVSTASAAGLLTQLGSAAYSVSKHAAVGFAEWLAITYGDRGVRVSCLCPMGVDTAMLRADEDTLGGRVVTAAGAVLTPDAVADATLAAVAEERFLVLPHSEVAEMWRRKSDDPERWIAGMRRLQSRLA